MTTRDIVMMFKELYVADISQTLVSQVTERVMEQVLAWQNRHLDNVYPIVFLDCLGVKVSQDRRVINKSIYVSLGINLSGQKELLGLWMAHNGRVQVPAIGADGAAGAGIEGHLYRGG
jgi:putative transposase